MDILILCGAILASTGVSLANAFYPVLSVGALALVCIASIVIFKEKFSVVQYIGIVLGVVAIVLLQL